MKAEERTESNILDAASRGASAAVFLVLNIMTNLIAILAFIAFVNAIIGESKMKRIKRIDKRPPLYLCLCQESKIVFK